jgi:rsbT antagonist protein RsbS
MEQETHSPVVLNRMGDVLVATVQTALTSSMLARFHDDLLNHLAADRSPALLLDLSGVSLMDVEEFDTLRKIASSAAIMGAETWFIGFRPEVVATLVSVGARTGGLRAALDLNAALNQIQRGRKGVMHE